MPIRKIATCCYCGTRAALVLTGTDRRELACSNCGAPLHDLKMLKSDHVHDRKRVKPSPLHDWQPEGDRARHDRRPKKRRKSFGKWFFEEAVDLIEDIFD
jgi:hypothetical protein